MWEKSLQYLHIVLSRQASSLFKILRTTAPGNSTFSSNVSIVTMYGSTNGKVSLMESD